MTRTQQQQQQNQTPKTKRYAGEIDVHIGKRIKMQRKLFGASQNEMADALEITFQQIQKYERGINRVSAASLLKIARFLDVPIAYFYEGYIDDNKNKSANDIDPDTLTKSETVKLIKSYYSIEDETLRRNLLSIMQAMSTNRND